MKYKLLRDHKGVEIDVGDIVRITDYYGVYEAPVVFRDGMFTIDKYKAKQVKNVKGWKASLKKTFPNENRTHDQVKSYGFIIHWGESISCPIMTSSLKKIEVMEKCESVKDKVINY